MEIIDYFKSDNPDHWLAEIKKGDWRAAAYLAEILADNTFNKLFGEGTLLLLTDGDRLISFMSLLRHDCIDDDTLYPWAGFVYTFPEFRGHRYAGKLLRRCEELAAEKGADKLYVCTDHVGLYEKYGFSYMESREDIHGDISRIYFKNI